MFLRLYLTAASPYARKARIVLLEKGVSFQPRFARFGGARTAAGGGESFPALVLDDGRFLYDVPAILQYAEQAWPQPALLPGEPEGRMASLVFDSLCDGICDALAANAREERRPRERRQPDRIARRREQVREALAGAEREIDGRLWAVGDSFGLADIALVCALDYVALHAPRLWTGRYPELAAFRARLARRSSVEQTSPPGLDRDEIGRHAHLRLV